MPTVKDAQRFRKIYSYYRPQPRQESFGGGVDESIVQGLDWKQSVKAASSTGENIDLTAPVSGLTVDSYPPVAWADGDRVLLKDQTTASENGIYYYDIGIDSFVRSLDAVAGTLTSGAAVYVEEGTTNAGCAFVLTTEDPFTVGTDALTWIKFAGAGSAIFVSTTTPSKLAKTEYSVSFDTDLRYASAIGSDVFFFVSGSRGSRDSAVAGAAVLGGDVIVSGSSYLLSGAFIRNGMQVTGTITTLGAMQLTGSFDVTGDVVDISGSLLISGSTYASGTVFLTGSLFSKEGSITATQGFSGSLTKLSNGTSFIIAGPNITVTSASNGSITIEGSAGGGGYFTSAVDGSAFTSGAFAFVGPGSEYSSIDAPSDKGNDVFFYVSGSIGSMESAVTGTALFGGDVRVSGSLKVGTGSITITSDDILFGGSSTKISKVGDNLNLSVPVGGALQITGSAIVSGDLTVDGTTTTINTTNLEVKDAVVGLGFSSGTVAVTSGDRGIIGSVVGADHVAILWKNASSEFAVGRTAASATGSLPVTLSSYSNFHAAAIQATIVTASLGFTGSLTKLSDGSDYITAGNNITTTTSSAGQVDVAIKPGGADKEIQFNVSGNSISGSSGFYFSYTTNTEALTLSGAFIQGIGTSANASRQAFAQGQYTIAQAQSSHAEGYSTRTTGNHSHAEGYSTLASGAQSHAEGYDTIASGQAAHAEGRGDATNSNASGNWSHSEGYNTKAVGDYSHTEGNQTRAAGSYAHAEGSSASAPGDHSHAEGSGTITSGSYSHAEGVNTLTTVAGGSAHAEGWSTTASNTAAHAEGYQTTASGVASHAEGSGSEAQGSYSHAEGYGTTAKGANSHAEGYGTFAIGDYSHAEGAGTHASGTFQTVVGKYNKRENVNSLFVIGNGTGAADLNRSDVVRVEPGVEGNGIVEVTGSVVATYGLSGSLTKLSDGTSYLIAGSNVTITSASNGAVTISSAGGGGGSGGGDPYAQYLVLSATGSLSDERVFTAGSGINATDGGAGGNFTLSINDSVVATVSGSTFTGATKHNAGLSGSLTQLTNGTSYLVAGTNVTITSASNGQVTISSAGGVTSVTGSFNDTGSKFVTTASVSFAGGQGFSYDASAVGSDVYFFVSGTTTENGDETDTDFIGSPKKAVFGGDVLVSGTVKILNDLFFKSGSLQIEPGPSPHNLVMRGSDATANVPAASFKLYGGNNTAGALGQAAGDINIQGGNNSQAGRAGDLTFAPGYEAVGGLDGNVRFYLWTVGSASFMGNDEVTAPSDTMFFVSGTVGPTASPRRALFGGDLTASGSVTAALGLSGSLTQLTDGTSYLVAGTNVTITSASNGQVTISSTGGGGGGSAYFTDPTSGFINATGSLSLAGALGSSHTAADVGNDVFLFVSGSSGSLGTSTRGVAAFGGDVAISGSLKIGTGSVTITSEFIQFNGVSTKISKSGNDLKFFDSLNPSGVTLSNLVSGSAYRTSFTSGDLVGGVLTTAHNLGNKYVSVTVYDDNDSQVMPDGVVATNSNVVSVDLTTFVPTFTGTWNVVVIAGAGGGQGGAGTSYFTSDVAGSIFTTGSVAFVGSGDEATTVNAPADKGADVNFYVSGSTGPGSTSKALFGGDVVTSGSILPGLDGEKTLGAPDHRWAHVYTCDLHLKNDRGDWTIIEEEDYLSIRNNRTGRRFKINMEPID